MIVNADPCRTTSEACRIYEALEDIIEHTLWNLHVIQKNLAFWESRAEVSCILVCGVVETTMIGYQMASRFTVIDVFRVQMLRKHTS